MNKTIELPKVFKLNAFFIFAFIIFSVGIIMLGIFFIETELSKLNLFGITFMSLFMIGWIRSFIKMLLIFHGKEIIIISENSIKYFQRFSILKQVSNIRKENIKEIIYINIQNSKYATMRMLGYSDHKVLITYGRRKKVLIGKFLSQIEATQLAENLNLES
jgi:hypothetical protein